jgi:GntR family transcriptional regulator
MKFQIDRQSRLPYPRQVERQATAQLITGRLHPGERLPSVRQLARELKISRTTAERIHEALCDAMLVEVRPRCGVFAASLDPSDHGGSLRWAHTVYQFLEEIAQRGEKLGLTRARLAQLFATLAEDAETEPRPPVPLLILATRDTFDCIEACLPPDFPAHLVHVAPSTRPGTLPCRARYLLCGYYLRDRARLLAESAGNISVLYVRYNVRLLDQAMSIPAGEYREFVTRDADNAEMTRAMLASAYPEVSPRQYSVVPLGDWLERAEPSPEPGEIWVTASAAAIVSTRTDPARIRVMHPVLAEDFIDELRCLALFLQSEASRP